MTVHSGIFNSVNGDRKYNAWWFAKYFSTFIGNGVFPNPSSNLQVVANTNMKVIVKPGSGWIDGYFLYNDSDHVLQLDIADGVLKRIDRVVLRLNHLTRQIELVVKKGTYASSPVAPTLQRNTDYVELALADVYIANGATVITQANITDQRLNSALCGIVHGTVNQVDTTTIFNQYKSWFDGFTVAKQQEFEQWIDDLNELLDGDVASNLLAQILQTNSNLNALQQQVTTHLDDYSEFKTETDIKLEVISNPSTGVEAKLNAHKEDYTDHIYYADDTGTANAKILTIPEVASYKKGLGISFVNKVANTGATTININGIGVVNLLDGKGAALKSEKLLANIPYTFRHNGTGFILQGEGGEFEFTPSVGTAVVAAAVGFGIAYDSNYKSVKRLVSNFEGTVTIQYDLYGGGTRAGYSWVYGQLYINGVAVGIDRSNNMSFSTFYSENFTLKKGDIIEFRIRGGSDVWGCNSVLAISYASNPIATATNY